MFRMAKNRTLTLREVRKLLFVSQKRHRMMTLDTINPNVKKMEYAVRGPIVIRAGEIEKELEQGVKKPFTEVVRANIGDCHATGQKPLTFIRQVAALVTDPDRLMKSPDYPNDAKQKAKRILDACGGQSVGAYSDSAGVPVIRKDVAEYISERDGIPADFNNVFLSTGASDAIKCVLQLLMTGKLGNERAGIMIPIPQYPLYSATLAEYNAFPINYYLDEDSNWGLNIQELNRSLDEVKGQCIPKALCVINPGNPTGQVLTRENIEGIIKFAKERNLVILADEVYQHNIYAKGSKFHSFRKVLKELGPEYTDVELTSFMSCSKGYMGECGLRGGFCEITNFDPDVRLMLMKSISARLCSSVIGQAVLDTIVNPPKHGDESYDLFEKEKNEVLSQLKEKAEMVSETFNAIEGVKCNVVQGAMYAFPQLMLPQKAIDAAKAKGEPADVFYVKQFLEETGVCVVPGSGFGQVPGTYHFRTTILPQIPQLREMLSKFKDFHLQFLKKYQ